MKEGLGRGENEEGRCWGRLDRRKEGDSKEIGQRRLKVKYQCLDVSLNCYFSKKMATDGLRDFEK